MDAVIVQHSAGLHVSYRPSNAQPPLSYTGPPLKPVLCRFEGGTTPTYELLTRFTVPSTGFKAAVQLITHDENVTRVHVALVHPDDPVLPVIQELRVVADVGRDPGATIELWIEETVQGCTCVSLAAVIETKF